MTGVGCAPAGGDLLLPGLVFLRRRGPRDVVDGAGAGDARVSGRDVVRVPGAALRAAHLPGVVALRLEGERLLEEAAARLGVGVGAHAVESLERELARDLGMVRDQRLVVGLRRRRSRGQALRVLEAEAGVGALRRDVLARRAAPPRRRAPRRRRRGRRSGAPSPPLRARGGRAGTRRRSGRFRRFPSRRRRRGGRRSGRPGSRTS